MTKMAKRGRKSGGKNQAPSILIKKNPFYNSSKLAEFDLSCAKLTLGLDVLENILKDNEEKKSNIRIYGSQQISRY